MSFSYFLLNSIIYVDHESAVSGSAILELIMELLGETITDFSSSASFMPNSLSIRLTGFASLYLLTPYSNLFCDEVGVGTLGGPELSAVSTALISFIFFVKPMKADLKS